MLKSFQTKNHLIQLKHRLNQLTKTWVVDDYHALLNFYVRILPRLMGAQRCTIFIHEIGTDKISSIYGTGLQENQIEPPKEGSIVGKVISCGVGVIENNLEKDEKSFHAQMAEKTRFFTRNLVCAPIKSLTGHSIIGAIQILNKTDDLAFDESDLKLLEEISNFIAISVESIVTNQEILRVSNQLSYEMSQLDQRLFANRNFIVASPAMEEVLQMVQIVSETPVNVLIQGDNGTGKELIARLIHEQSKRSENPFVAVNCAAIPENLMESEFFGYEKGAFTGAAHFKRGLFEEAEGGSLFLDEIAEMPLTLQPKFLRAIAEGEGCRLGSNKKISYNLRIISATNKDLTKEVEKGNFREDLFFRLFSVEIYLPPLKERKEEILPLCAAFLEEFNRRFNKQIPGFSQELIHLFETYFWPGNIRQLRREVERLVALTKDGQWLTIENASREVKEYGQQKRTVASHNPSDTLSLPEQIEKLEIYLIEKALQKTAGNRVQAAKLLNITRQGLYKKMERYQIKIKNK